MLLYLHMDSLVSTQDKSFYLIFPPKAYSSEHADILILRDGGSLGHRQFTWSLSDND